MSNLKINLLKLVALLLFISISIDGFGQISTDNDIPKRNSPYSSLGLGDPALQNYVPSLGMGGLGASFTDKFHVNLVNPASIGFLNAATFEIGGFARAADLTSDDFELNTFAGNFSYISLGFPLKNPINIELDGKKPLLDWRMNFSLTPFTDVGFTIQTNTPIPETQDSLVSFFTGKGGTYKIAWTNAVKFKDLSVGLDLGYLFGNLITESTAIFAEDGGLSLIHI